MAQTQPPDDPGQRTLSDITKVLVFVAFVAGGAGLLGAASTPTGNPEVAEVVSVVEVWEYPRSSRLDYTYRLAGETEGIAYTVDLQTQHHFDLGDVVDVVVEPDTQTVQFQNTPPANIAWWVAGLSLLAAFLTPLLGERFRRRVDCCL